MYDSPSSQFWDQLASSIAFGLSFATVLTLLVTPALLSYKEIAKEKRRLKRANKVK
jgi:multidrug efflux pump